MSAPEASRATVDANRATFRPIDPLPPTDPKLWRKVAGKKKGERPTYALGNRAVVEEITGNKTEPGQRWRWRVIKFGAPKAQECLTREAAMRAAEFLLGVGEMEVEK